MDGNAPIAMGSMALGMMVAQSFGRTPDCSRNWLATLPNKKIFRNVENFLKCGIFIRFLAIDEHAKKIDKLRVLPC